MEFKWLMVFGAVVLSSMFCYLAYSNYVKADCAASYAESDRSADDIIKICGVIK